MLQEFDKGSLVIHFAFIFLKYFFNAPHIKLRLKLQKI